MNLANTLHPHRAVPVLLYHRVAVTTPEDDPFGLAVHPSAFEAQMSYLRRLGMTTCTVQELIDHDGRTLAGAGNRVAITFDDGYLDTYTTAFPILCEHGFSATVFLVAGLLGKAQGCDSGQQLRYMEWSQAKEMCGRGISFQSHTFTHPDLTTLGEEATQRELIDSRKTIEDRLGVPVDHFAYPFGRFNRTTVARVQEAGYKSAFAAGGCNVARFSRERFQIVSRAGMMSFMLRASSWGSWIRKFYLPQA